MFAQNIHDENGNPIRVEVIRDRNGMLPTIVNGIKFLNLTGQTIHIVKANTGLIPIKFRPSASYLHTVTAQPSYENFEIAGMRVTRRTYILNGELPAPQPNTYIIVRENVLKTRQAKGRTDLLTPEGGAIQNARYANLHHGFTDVI